MAKTTLTSSGAVTLADGGTVNVNIAGGGFCQINGSPQGGVQEININLQNNPASDHVTVNLSTFNQSGLMIDIKNYSANDQVTLQGATITGLVPGSTDQLAFTYTGSNGATFTGVAKIKGPGPNSFTSPQKPLVICFTTGTSIRTDKGDRSVESLSRGDLVQTLHNGLQPVRWIGKRKMTDVDFSLNPKIRPIQIDTGALGPNRPSRDMRVSPQHRMMIEGSAADLLFGVHEVLVAALHLVNDHTIRHVEQPGPTTYYHLLFDRHEVIYADDALAESLHPGDEAMTALDQAARDEVLAIFPELETMAAPERKTALPVLKAFESRVLARYVGGTFQA